MKNLNPTSVVKTFSRENDGSGYGYDIVASRLFTDSGINRGWKAEVTFKAFGSSTPEGSISHLEPAVERFLADLHEAKPDLHWGLFYVDRNGVISDEPSGCTTAKTAKEAVEGALPKKEWGCHKTRPLDLDTCPVCQEEPGEYVHCGCDHHGDREGCEPRCECRCEWKVEKIR